MRSLEALPVCEIAAVLNHRSLNRINRSAAQIRIQPLVEKAAALGFFLIANHPFVDGNKRIGHAALEVTLILNGLEIDASIDEQEKIILAVASGQIARDGFTEWVRQHVHRAPSNST